MTLPRKRRERADSTEAQVRNLNGREIPQPPGVELRSEEENIIWSQFTRARAYSDWREFDLVLLAKVVRLEADIRKYQLMLDRSGPLVKNKRETLIENPILRVIDTLQRQQLAIIRSMSLNQQAADPRTLNASGRTIDQDPIGGPDSVQSLLAGPVH